jgi:hypothetical protein
MVVQSVKLAGRALLVCHQSSVATKVLAQLDRCRAVSNSQEDPAAREAVPKVTVK